MTRLFFPLIIVGCQLIELSFAAQCYLLNGGQNDAKAVAPCNTSATGTDGSHSTCCNKANGDACLSSGLCLNTIAYVQGHMLWATGCTDKTLKDPSCPQVCQDSKYGGNGNYALRSCVANGTKNDWCCSTDDDQTLNDCCKNSFKLSTAIGTVVHQLTPSSSSASTSETPSSTASDSACPTASTCPAEANTGYIAGIAVTSVLCGLATIALAGAMVYIRRLKRQAKAARSPSTVNGTLAPSAAEYSMYQQSYSPATTTTPAASNAGEYPPYAYGQQVRPELGGAVVSEMQGASLRPNIPELPEKTTHQLP